MSPAERRADFFCRAGGPGLTPREIIETCWDQDLWCAADFEGDPGKQLRELAVAAKFVVCFCYEQLEQCRIQSFSPDPPDVRIVTPGGDLFFEVTDAVRPGTKPRAEAMARESENLTYQSLSTDEEREAFLDEQLERNAGQSQRAHTLTGPESIEKDYQQKMREQLIGKARKYTRRKQEQPSEFVDRPPFGLLLHSRFKQNYARAIGLTDGILTGWLTAEERELCEIFPDIFIEDSDTLTFASLALKREGAWLNRPKILTARNPWFR